MAMDFLDHIIANRRANMIAEVMDHSEYWKAQYEQMLDKYNKLARKYDHDISQSVAERDCLVDIIRDNLDNLNISRDAINERMDNAANLAGEKYQL